MQSVLQEIVAGNIFAFLLIFMRFGTVMMLMPGISDSFVPPQVRLLFALAISFILAPVLAPTLPSIPSGMGPMLSLIVTEAFIGIFIGTVMRIIVSALDTAGTIASVQSGLSNAMVFNPSTESQGSIIGAFYSAVGVTIILVSDMHHYMLSSVIDSYIVFPATGVFPDIGSMSEVISKVVSIAFKIGVQIAMPLIVVGILMQMGLGFLGRLMPQMQIFFVAMPVQIFLTLLIIAITISSSIIYWINSYEEVLYQSLTK